ncbi:MAG: YbjN domain-containing protein [Nocardioidaceae bacterium]|nr:YbjN domain-containing protein [Nocardioidaceae bacterium]
MNIEWFRAYVEKLLRGGLIDEPKQDSDGDYLYRWGTAACWVRLSEQPFWRVDVFAHAVLGVKPTARLLREINETNARLVSGRIYTAGGVVVVEQSVLADGLTADTLAQACVAVGSAANDLGPLLAVMFDGQTPFPAEAEPISSEGA